MPDKRASRDVRDAVQAELEKAAKRKQRQVELDMSQTIISRFHSAEITEDLPWMFQLPCTQKYYRICSWP